MRGGVGKYLGDKEQSLYNRDGPSNEGLYQQLQRNQ